MSKQIDPVDEILEALHWLPVQDKYDEPHPIYPGDDGLNDNHIREARKKLDAHYKALYLAKLPGDSYTDVTGEKDKFEKGYKIGFDAGFNKAKARMQEAIEADPKLK